MKKMLFVVLFMMVANTCFANGLVMNNIVIGNPVGMNRITTVQATLDNPTNYEHQRIDVLIQFFDANGNALYPQTKTNIDYVKPNSHVTFNFNCTMPQNATQYRVLFQANEVIIPNYVHYQNHVIFTPHRTMNNVLTSAILSSIFR